MNRSRGACLGLLVALAGGCAGQVPSQPSVLYKGATIPIDAVPKTVALGASWVVKAFARGDSLVRGYIDADERARRELASVQGIRFLGPSPWGAVVFDWIGLHVLSHEGYVVSQNMPAVKFVQPAIHNGLVESMMRDGVTEIRCIVRIVIDAEGNVAAAGIHASSGYDVWDRAALEAATQAKYGPAAEQRRPVPLESDMYFDVDVAP